MNPVPNLYSYALRDLARSRGLLGLGLLLLISTDFLFRWSAGPTAGLLALSEITRLGVPLVAMVLGIAYLHRERDYIELLLTQPVPRRAVFTGIYGAHASALCAMYVVGIGLPMALHGAAMEWRLAATVVISGVLLILVFSGLAFWIGLSVRDRTRAFATALAVWAAITFVYDGVLLVAVQTFGASTLRDPSVFLALLNPVDVQRILSLVQSDVAAFPAFSSAAFTARLGGPSGLIAAWFALVVWALAPMLLAARRFRTMDV